MSSVRPCEIPGDAFLRRYDDGCGFADCYSTDLPEAVSQAAFVEAFYTTALFKVERTLLAWLASRPSTDIQAKGLAQGTASSFAAWRVEAQDSEQLLLADISGRTRSWLKAVPLESAGGSAGTRLYFGSAVVPRNRSSAGTSGMGIVFRALLGFHRIYSRLLLRAARARLLSTIHAAAS